MQINRIAIRREDKNEWERRTPLTPENVSELRRRAGIDFTVQPSKIRAFADGDYERAGARIDEDLSGCDIILAVKEVPERLLLPEHTYVYFSHVIKGQKYNMLMLKRLLELQCSLIDYEKIVDDAGRRLIFFGRYAGVAGMIETLRAFGLRMADDGIPNPFAAVKSPYQYADVEEAKEAIRSIGVNIEKDGLPEKLASTVVGFAGYGHVSRGAQEVFDVLPVTELSPQDLLQGKYLSGETKHRLFKVVFKEEHMVEPRDPKDCFELQDYYDHPEKYRGRFEEYAPHLSILVNCIYWDTPYPRLLTKEFVKRLYTTEENPRLKVIGDISSDIEGSVEMTLKVTQPDDPVFVYDPVSERVVEDGSTGGIHIMAVDNLPCEFAREASMEFGAVLKEFIPDLARADFSRSFDKCNLPGPLKRATIVYRGELTPSYEYLKAFLG